MEKETLNTIWNYFLTLENDLANTSRYIEPKGQENVYSFEFAKLIILACTEIESVFKLLCNEIDNTKSYGNIGQYKETILHKYPKIVQAEVRISRLGKQIKPFENWDSGKLDWWTAYTNIKHNRDKSFNEATYINAAMALSALYILIWYTAHNSNLSDPSPYSEYITSSYQHGDVYYSPEKQLPDFEEVN